MLTLYTTPVVYLYIQGFIRRERRQRREQRRRARADAAQAGA
jgi:hypothetical protein